MCLAGIDEHRNRINGLRMSGPQFLNIAKFKGSHYARGDTARLFTLGTQLNARIAFMNGSRCFVILRMPIGTGHYAAPAANAYIIIVLHGAIYCVNIHSSCGTDLNARRIQTVVARN
jgi:hypothetical protein